MATRTKVLVVDGDLDTLSKIYLSLLHRNYKVEAADKAEEIGERIKRFKPAVLILGKKIYDAVQEALKVPGILLLERSESLPQQWKDDLVAIYKPVQIEELVRTIDDLVI
ncbi:MAG TPA: hypothetical protein VFR58_10485 [Flavisolibacter sp.]|nr:hypothetical protein [Flavisolibacter sp.]